MYHATQNENFEVIFFLIKDLGWTWPDTRLSKAYEGHGSIPDTMHAVLSVSFQVDTALLPDESSDDRQA